MCQVIFIDNFDSFSYNLVDLLKSLSLDVTIFRNTVSMATITSVIDTKDKPLIMLSPGPSDPLKAGICLELIEKYKGKVPIIGICLGHQAIVMAYGGQIEQCSIPVHGKSSILDDINHPIFTGMTRPITVARYHSLKAHSVPHGLSLLALSEQVIMAVINEADKICGFQFHPESIMTPEGDRLIKNVIHWAFNKEI